MVSSVTLAAAATPAAPALVLRPWRLEDVPALIEVYRDPASDPGRGGMPRIEGEDDARRWIGVHEQGWAVGGRFGFAVVEEGDFAAPAPKSAPAPPQVVGHVVLKEVAVGKSSAEVGYWTAAHARGRGVAPRALAALTDWAFDAFRGGGLHTLELLHQVDNPASCRVAQKCGFPFERILPAAPPSYPLDGHLHVRRATV